MVHTSETTPLREQAPGALTEQGPVEPQPDQPMSNPVWVSTCAKLIPHTLRGVCSDGSAPAGSLSIDIFEIRRGPRAMQRPRMTICCTLPAQAEHILDARILNQCAAAQKATQLCASKNVTKQSHVLSNCLRKSVKCDNRGPLRGP